MFNSMLSKGIKFETKKNYEVQFTEMFVTNLSSLSRDL